jgi:hypothetical protein
MCAVQLPSALWHNLVYGCISYLLVWGTGRLGAVVIRLKCLWILLQCPVHGCGFEFAIETLRNQGFCFLHGQQTSQSGKVVLRSAEQILQAKMPFPTIIILPNWSLGRDVDGGCAHNALLLAKSDGMARPKKKIWHLLAVSGIFFLKEVFSNRLGGYHRTLPRRTCRKTMELARNHTTRVIDNCSTTQVTVATNACSVAWELLVPEFHVWCLGDDPWKLTDWLTAARVDGRGTGRIGARIWPLVACTHHVRQIQIHARGRGWRGLVRTAHQKMLDLYCILVVFIKGLVWYNFTSSFMSTSLHHVLHFTSRALHLTWLSFTCRAVF